jgi:hypothetical protein
LKVQHSFLFGRPPVSGHKSELALLPILVVLFPVDHFIVVFHFIDFPSRCFSVGFPAEILTENGITVSEPSNNEHVQIQFFFFVWLEPRLCVLI